MTNRIAFILSDRSCKNEYLLTVIDGRTNLKLVKNNNSFCLSTITAKPALLQWALETSATPEEVESALYEYLPTFGDGHEYEGETAYFFEHFAFTPHKIA